MVKSSAKHNNQHAHVFFFPPFVGLVFAVISISLHIIVPLPITSNNPIALVTGIIILISGILLQVICLRVLNKAKTTPLFKKPTTSLLQSGPYAKSRNPIYIAVFLQFFGLAFLVNTWWIITILPVLYLYLRYGVIAREEQYLEQKFGDEYRKYQSDVPRWL